MKYYYSPSTSGFYIDVVNTTMPADVIEITAEDHTALMEGQSKGKVIAYQKRKLVLIDYVAPELTWEDIRNLRETKLSGSDWTQMPDNGMADDLRAA